jgi:hypothetical protein
VLSNNVLLRADAVSVTAASSATAAAPAPKPAKAPLTDIERWLFALFESS